MNIFGSLLVIGHKALGAWADAGDRSHWTDNSLECNKNNSYKRQKRY